MSSFSITLANKTFLPSDLENPSLESLSPAEQHAVLFCAAWQRGQENIQLHTSGSTGQPKAITLTRAQLIASARLTETALSLKKGKTALVCLDTRLVGGMMMLVRGMEIGMQMVVTEPVANPLAQVPATTNIDFTALVPYQLKSILQSPQAERLNRIQTIIVGGGDVDATLETSVKEFSSAFYATYGMTETISHVALRKLNDGTDFFKALPGIHLSLDNRGCLCVSAGYLGDKPIVTNDLVELNGSSFRWLGRADFVINSGGVKVIPEKVEADLAPLLSGTRFFIHGFPHDKWGQEVCLVVEGSRWEAEKKIRLLDLLRNTLSRYEVPKRILYVEKFVLAGNDKINRVATARLVSP